MTVIAHISGGHWYEALLYLAPVAAVVAALWWSARGQPEDDDQDASRGAP
jgi:hypothetical protein